MSVTHKNVVGWVGFYAPKQNDLVQTHAIIEPNMSSDFEVVSKRHVPIWREAKRAKRKYIAEIVMALASFFGLVLLWSQWQDRNYIGTPISFQLAEGDWVAVSLFAFMGLILLLMAMRLWRAERKPSACLMVFEVAALVFLALSDPESTDHLLMFGAVALTSAGWLVVLALELEDQWLKWAAAFVVGSLFLIPENMGIGERVLITSCLVGINLMFFRHFE